MRVVLDTNILISALLGSRAEPPAPPARILAAWRGGRFEVFTAAAQIAEIERVLRYPKIQARLQKQLAQALVEDFYNVAAVLPKLTEISVSSDPDDDILLAIAHDAGADYLVSGDKAGLLVLRQFKRTQIVSARDFLRQLET